MGDHLSDKYTGAVRRCIHIVWPGKASEKTPRGFIPPVYVKYIAERLKKKSSCTASGDALNRVPT
jgi:hypothetical protein